MKTYVEMTQQVGRNLTSIVLGTILASLMIFWVLEGKVPKPQLLLWASAQALLLTTRVYFARVFNQLNTENEAWTKALALHTWAMLLIGLCWGMASVLAALHGTLVDQVVVLAILLGMLSAAITTVGYVLSSFTALLGGTMLLQIISLLLQPGDKQLILSFITSIYCIVVYRSASILATSTKDLVEMRENFATAKAVAEKANKAKSQFLSSMSHELRTPLNAILGFSQLLNYEKLKPAQTSYVDEIRTAGEHLLSLISDILTLSTIEIGKINIELKPIKINKTITECKTLVATQAKERNIRLNINLPDNDLEIIADSVRLKQVLLNFMSNAIKYNVLNGLVTVTAQRSEADMCRIQVTDTGRGIPLDKQPLLFQPFNRLGRESGTIEGSGIGLVLSKELTELMGGKIGFESKPDNGCKFWIDIPLAHSTATTTTNV